MTGFTIEVNPTRDPVPDRVKKIRDMRARGMTLAAIGEVYGVTRERIRQILVKAAARGWIRPDEARRRRKDYAGERFGPFRVTGPGKKRYRWMAACEHCGRERSFSAPGLRTIRSRGTAHCIGCAPRQPKDLAKPALVRDLYERDGKRAQVIADELEVTVGRVYQLLTQARREGL